MTALETVRDGHGNELDFRAATMLMDDGIREQLHREMAPCGMQEFYDAYCERHEERYGRRFEV